MLPPPFRPMLAAPAEQPFDDPGHLFEPKLDGFRALAFCDRGAVALYSRTGRDVTGGYPDVVSALGAIHGDAVLDGELVVLDEDGIPRFQLMQQRNFAVRPPGPALERFPVRFMAFDLCWRDGSDLRELTLGERRAALLALDTVATVPAVVGDGWALYDEACRVGFEGVVAKRLDSPYRPGLRSRAWRKVKAAHHDRVVVVGFTPGTGGRGDTFGALVMAQWAETGLVHVGELGTGFDDKTLRALHAALSEIVVRSCPLAEPVRIPGGVTWVEPGVVVDVEHRGWTRDRRLRAPSFKGVEVGVDPQSVVFRGQGR